MVPSSSNAALPLARRIWRFSWIIAGLFLLLLGIFLLQLVAASPPITISKQTTHITEPLGANGLPDYEKHLLDVSRRGIYHACRALLARAMWHVGETRPMDAWNDVHAIDRLSRLLSEGVIPGEQSKARDLNTMACYATETILHHGDLTADDARRIHDDLIRLKPLSIADDSFLLHQRLLALDAFVYVASGGDSDQLSGLIDVYTMVFEWIEPDSIDWNIVLRETNHMYDRVAAAAGAKDRATRINAIETIEKDLARRASSIGELGDLAKAAFNRHERSQLFATVMLGVLLSSFEAATAADDRANAKVELTKLAAALAIYREEHGRYPEKLDLLVPGPLKEVP